MEETMRMYKTHINFVLTHLRDLYMRRSGLQNQDRRTMVKRSWRNYEKSKTWEWC